MSGRERDSFCQKLQNLAIAIYDFCVGLSVIQGRFAGSLRHVAC